jgi:HEAT repeat protein
VFIPKQALAEDDPDPIWMGKRRSEWIHQISDEYPENRIRAIRMISQHGSDAKVTVPELKKALHDLGEQAEDRTIELLAGIATFSEDDVPLLVKDLEDGSKKVRRFALNVLQCFGPKAKSAVPAMIDLLRRDDAELRRSGLDILTPIGLQAKDAIAAVRNALRDNDETVRISAVKTFAAINPDAANIVKTLIELGIEQESEDRTLQYRIDRAFDRLDKSGKLEDDAFQPMLNRLKDKEAKSRIAAIYWIGKFVFRINGSFSALCDLLKNDADAKVRLAAVKMLSQVGQIEAIPALTIAVSDADEDVRNESEKALKKSVDISIYRRASDLIRGTRQLGNNEEMAFNNLNAEQRKVFILVAEDKVKDQRLKVEGAVRKVEAHNFDETEAKKQQLSAEDQKLRDYDSRLETIKGWAK